jgi:hypothetical protein
LHLLHLLAELLDLVAQGSEQRPQLFLAALGKTLRFFLQNFTRQGFELVSQGLLGGLQERQFVGQVLALVALSASPRACNSVRSRSRSAANCAMVAARSLAKDSKPARAADWDWDSAWAWDNAARTADSSAASSSLRRSVCAFSAFAATDLNKKPRTIPANAAAIAAIKACMDLSSSPNVRLRPVHFLSILALRSRSSAAHPCSLILDPCSLLYTPSAAR